MANAYHLKRLSLLVGKLSGKYVPKEELLKYLDESLENAEVSDTRFCANSCLNGILQYYAALAEKQGIRDQVKIMVGGAPINEEFCKAIGADCYTVDAASASDAAVELCKGLK